MPVPHQLFHSRELLAAEATSYTHLLAIWASSDDPDDPETIITIIRDIPKCPQPAIGSQMTRVICFLLFTLPGTLADPISGSQIPTLDPYENLIYSQDLLVLSKTKCGYC
jgi:hypothetical protein